MEVLDQRMVSAFDSTLLLLPRPPSNRHYDDFLNESREYSYRVPFNAPTPPPHLNITIPVNMLVFCKYVSVMRVRYKVAYRAN